MTDPLPFDEMADQTPTLTWLEGVLNGISLGLDDVIIMDLFPKLTDDWLDEHPAERDQAIAEMFELTLDAIRESRLPTYLLSSLVNAFALPSMSAGVHSMVCFRTVLRHGPCRALNNGRLLFREPFYTLRRSVPV